MISLRAGCQLLLWLALVEAGLLASGMPAPGASATTVHAAEHWDSLHDLLLPGKNLLPGLTAQAPPDCGPCRPPFFADAFNLMRDGLQPVSSCNPRALSLVALVLDSLASEPCHRVLRGPGISFYARTEPRSLAASVSRAVCRTAELLQMWDEHLPVTAETMGRAAGKVEKVEEQLRELKLADGPLYPLTASAMNVAKDVEVSRLSFPEPPSFDPCPFLDEAMRGLYLGPSRHTVELDSVDEPPPVVKFRACNKRARMDFLAALDSGSRLALFSGDAYDPRTACGLFAIPKNLHSDRLIVDARPSNLCVRSDTRWVATMAAASNLLDVELSPSECLVMSGEDVKDYYYITTSRFLLTVQPNIALWVFSSPLRCNISRPSTQSCFGVSLLSLRCPPWQWEMLTL